MDKQSIKKILESVTPVLDQIKMTWMRRPVAGLLNLVEIMSSENEEKNKKIQNLKDEINRLKGEQGKPDIRPQTTNEDKQDDHSSEKERKKRRKKKKKKIRSKKRDVVKPDRTVKCEIDKSTLPADAQYKGIKSTVIQDIKITTDNVEFQRDIYYSPSLGKTFVAPLPGCYEGEFGPAIKSCILYLYHDCNMTEPAINNFLNTFNIHMSNATVSRILIDKKDVFHQEKEDVVDAGLKAPYHQADDTSARVYGKNHNVHILCNPLFTAYFTRPKKDRLTLLEILCRGELKFTLNGETLKLLGGMNLSKKQHKNLVALGNREAMTRVEMDELLLQLFPNPKKHATNRRNIFEASALIYYRGLDHALKHLMCDDAPQFNLIAEYKSLCWIHEGRHYKKLRPLFSSHRKALDDFREGFWDYYQKLLDYTENPVVGVAEELKEEFDVLFTAKTGYTQLDERIALTAAKKEALLLPLQFPFLPLHNNESENGAQHQARLRDIHLQTRNEKGTKAKDTFATIVKTARKLNVNIFDYFYDRITQRFSMSSLADLILEKCDLAPDTS